MEGGTASPLGVPVFKGRKQEAENAITPLPGRVGNPALEKPQKPGNAKMRSWSICGNGVRPPGNCKTQCPLQRAWNA